MSDFTKAFRNGLVCLHPTDTVPGFTCDPTNESAMARLREIKGHSDRPYIGLVGSVGIAARYWQDLSPLWQTILEKIWPNPLSVVLPSSALAPKNMLNSDAALCLRQPKLQADSKWFIEFLENATLPIPTTSVNRAGEIPATNWQEAVQFSMNFSEIYIPEHQTDEESKASGKPSTIIEPSSEGFTVLRAGEFEKSRIENIFNEVLKNNL